MHEGQPPHLSSTTVQGTAPGSMAPTSLRAAASGASLNREHKVAEWNGQVSESSFHVFVNQTSEPLQLCYESQKDDVHHGTIEPGQNLFVGEPGVGR